MEAGEREAGKIIALSTRWGSLSPWRPSSGTADASPTCRVAYTLRALGGSDRERLIQYESSVYCVLYRIFIYGVFCLYSVFPYPGR